LPKPWQGAATSGVWSSSLRSAAVRGPGHPGVEAGRQPDREDQGRQPAHSHDDAFRGCSCVVHPLSAAALQRH